MNRFLQQFSGYVLVAVVLVVGALTGVRNGLDLAGLMIIGFLLAEIGKKNGFYTRFYHAMPLHQAQHEWLGAKAEGRRPGMGNVVFQANTPFTALVGLYVQLPFGISWFHTYGCVESDEHGVVVVCTWFGKRPCTFLYQTSIPVEQIEISHAQEFQGEGWNPMYTHWPHWYQMWPFYFFG